MLHHRTWAEIDLGALERNLSHVRSAAGDGVGVMLVLKADAYGHGAIPVAWHLTRSPIAYLGVGDSSEALELRSAGITTPILVLGAVVEGELEQVIRGRIAVTVHACDRVRALRKVVRANGVRSVGLHLKVDTGMGRLGCDPERALGIAREIRRSRGLHLEGVATHLAATTPDGGSRAELQLKRFHRVLAQLDGEDLRPRWLHAHASGGILSDLDTSFNLVRPGLAVYGVDPHGREDSPLEPVLRWRTQIVFLKDHKRGSAIGYEGTWKAPRRSRIATLPVGYDDGYRYAWSNRAHVIVRGRRCPVVGRVSMDYICVDISKVPGARVGDRVTLLGRDGEERVSVEELARLGDTIPYEVFCGIGRRVQRLYVESPEDVPSEATRT